ncbi:hypothetical protein Tco_1284072 [Tanacetum coccineum]
MDYEQLFTEFNVGTARQACLIIELRMRTKYGLSERNRLESKCEKQADSLKIKDDEIGSLKAQLLLKEAEAAEALRLRTQIEAAEQAHAHEVDVLKRQNIALDKENATLSVYQHLKKHFEEFQDAQMNIVNEKVAKLDANLMEMGLHLEEKFYPHLLTTISERRWLLTRGLKLAFTKFLDLKEYLTALGTAISRAIEKGMQDGLAASIDHRKKGRSLTDIVAYNPAAEADYNPSIQKLRDLDFPLFAELSSQKDANIEDIMNLLRLEGPLAGAPGMSDLQPDGEQLTLLIHRGAFDSVPITAATTTTLSTIFASTSSIPPITVDDYEVVCTDDQEDVQGNVASFPTVEFEKEDLDDTPEHASAS